MKKLSEEDKKIILARYKLGISKSCIAKEFNVTTGSISYQLKQNLFFEYKKPTCYTDFLRNKVALMEKRISKNFYEERQLIYVRSEILRVKRQIRSDVNRFNSENCNE